MKFILIDSTRQQNCINHLLHVPLDGKTEVEFRPVKAKRSLAQNDLYWQWMTYLQDEIGETKENIHLYFKHMFLKRDDIQVFGEYVTPEITTTKLTVKEFTEYLQNIELYVLEKLGYSFPVTDDYKLAFGKGKK